MGEADGRIPVHFFGAPKGFGKPLVVIGKHFRQRIKQMRGEFGAIGFWKTECERFDLSECDHERNMPEIGNGSRRFVFR